MPRAAARAAALVASRPRRRPRTEPSVEEGVGGAGVLIARGVERARGVPRCRRGARRARHARPAQIPTGTGRFGTVLEVLSVIHRVHGVVLPVVFRRTTDRERMPDRARRPGVQRPSRSPGSGECCNAYDDERHGERHACRVNRGCLVRTHDDDCTGLGRRCTDQFSTTRGAGRPVSPVSSSVVQCRPVSSSVVVTSIEHHATDSENGCLTCGGGRGRGWTLVDRRTRREGVHPLVDDRRRRRSRGHDPQRRRPLRSIRGRGSRTQPGRLRRRGARSPWPWRERAGLESGAARHAWWARHPRRRASTAPGGLVASRQRAGVRARSRRRLVDRPRVRHPSQRRIGRCGVVFDIDRRRRPRATGPRAPSRRRGRSARRTGDRRVRQLEHRVRTGAHSVRLAQPRRRRRRCLHRRSVLRRRSAAHLRVSHRPVRRRRSGTGTPRRDRVSGVQHRG